MDTDDDLKNIKTTLHARCAYLWYTLTNTHIFPRRLLPKITDFDEPLAAYISTIFKTCDY